MRRVCNAYTRAGNNRIFYYCTLTDGHDGDHSSPLVVGHEHPRITWKDKQNA